MQADNTANGATGQTLTVVGQSCTGSSSTGGVTKIAAPSGTSTDGTVDLVDGAGGAVAQVYDNVLRTQAAVERYVAQADVSSTDYTVAANDHILYATGANDVNLPAGDAGRELQFKNGNGATPIAINPDGSDTIDGSGGYSLLAGTAVKLVYNSVTSDWMVM